MTYNQRLSLLIFIDSSIVITAVIFSCMLANELPNLFTMPMVVSTLTVLISYHLFSLKLKLYKKAWEYASIGELIIIFKVITGSILVTAVIQQIVLKEIYFTLLIDAWLLHILLVSGSRICWRIYRNSFIEKNNNKKRTLIIGAGSAGTMVARQLQKRESDLIPVGFIDDDVRKQKLDILGIPVLGGLVQ